MSPQEFWLIADQRKPPEMVGAMKKETFDELRQMLHEGEVKDAESR
jgi:hypothetical protein